GRPGRRPREGARHRRAFAPPAQGAVRRIQSHPVQVGPAAHGPHRPRHPPAADAAGRPSPRHRAVRPAWRGHPGLRARGLPMNRMVLGLVLVAAATALPGCRVFKASCEAPPAGEEIATIPPLKTPAGITPPDTSNALRIPDLAQAERIRPPSAPCLEDPPLYTPGWQPEEKRIDPNAPEAAGEAQKKNRW